MPSVQAQTYPDVEHIIISDGPDDVLLGRVCGQSGKPGPVHVGFDWLPEHPAARWGHFARLRGIEAAQGDYIAWLDDDNAYRPQHIERLTAALEDNPDAGFAYTQILMHGHGEPYVVGAAPPSCGQIDTSAIMHRRELLQTATWRDEGQQTNEWDLVSRWMAAGTGWAFVPEVTADYYFQA